MPTAGVVAAQGIPGFSFAAPTTVTSGTLRPPASPGNTGWDIDGNGQADFNLLHQNPAGNDQAFLIPQAPFIANPNGLLVTNDDSTGLIRNLRRPFARKPSLENAFLIPNPRYGAHAHDDTTSDFRIS